MMTGGNITYYVGLQDDYDMGITWNGRYGIFNLYAGFFKNQQLSASSPQRYDTDIFPGEVSSDYLISHAKRNKEVNQFNLMAEINPSGNNWSIKAGLGGMFGQLYNMDTDDYGTRLAAEAHFGLDLKNFHFSLQETWYDYDQKLPDSATQDMKDFINVSSWNFAYEIPKSANIFTASTKYDFIGEKLSAYVNYSLLSGGTSQAQSQLITAGASTIWSLFQIYGEVHYGINDPQLSGNASGYGRDANSTDIGFQIRFYYTMSIVNKRTIEKIKEKIQEKQEKLDKE